MQFKTTLKTSFSLIDLTPLVDVIFLLLIFFIISSDIFPLKSLNIENPTLEKPSSPLTSRLLVVMDAQNVLYLGSKKQIIDFSNFKEEVGEEIQRMQAEHPSSEVNVVLSVDKKVEYGPFLHLFSLAQECGQPIRLIYQTPEDIPDA